jgi:hypothetical protein
MARLSRRRPRAGLRERVKHEPRNNEAKEEEHELRPTDFIGANGGKAGT